MSMGANLSSGMDRGSIVDVQSVDMVRRPIRIPFCDLAFELLIMYVYQVSTLVGPTPLSLITIRVYACSRAAWHRRYHTDPCSQSGPTPAQAQGSIATWDLRPCSTTPRSDISGLRTGPVYFTR